MRSMAFTVLTTLAPPHQLLDPSTIVSDGLLEFGQTSTKSAGGSHRVVPISGAASYVLDGDDGPMGSLLHVPTFGAGGFLGEFASVVGCASDRRTDQRPTASFQAHELVPLSIHALMSGATSIREQAAVMAYAGILATGVRSQRIRDELEAPDFAAVARRIDGLVAEAGFSIDEPKVALAA